MMSTFESYTDSASILGQRYEDLLSTQKYVDCSFSVDKTTIKCHKLILAAASPVFEAMFYGSISEDKCINILDISPKVFLLLIRYIYVGEIDSKNENVQNLMELYYSAEKYMLPDLVTFCLNTIKSKIHFGNILPAYDLSIQMGLKPLIQLFSNFFSKCCMKNAQYGKALKLHYYHVNKDCLENIIKNNKTSKYLIAFTMEWCQNQCKKSGKNEIDCNNVLNNVDLSEIQLIEEKIEMPKKMKKCFYTKCSFAERQCYKACRPFTVSNACFQFSTFIKSNWYVQMIGVIINSRLIPKTSPIDTFFDQMYNESMCVEIWCNNEIIQCQKLSNEKTYYNCFIDIPFDNGIVVSPDEAYLIKFIWNKDAYGAEYPLSIHSNRARAIHFMDSDSSYFDNGSLLKGIKYVDLI